MDRLKLSNALSYVQLWKFDGLERGLTLRPASEERQRTEKQEGTARLQIENVESIFQTHCVAFSCDGRLLGAGMEDMVVRVWQVATGKEVASFTGHKGAIRSVAFSPDGRLLASGSDDMFVRIWDVGHL